MAAETKAPVIILNEGARGTLVDCLLPVMIMAYHQHLLDRVLSVPPGVVAEYFLLYPPSETVQRRILDRMHLTRGITFPPTTKEAFLRFYLNNPFVIWSQTLSDEKVPTPTYTVLPRYTEQDLINEYSKRHPIYRIPHESVMKAFFAAPDAVVDIPGIGQARKRVTKYFQGTSLTEESYGKILSRAATYTAFRMIYPLPVDYLGALITINAVNVLEYIADDDVAGNIIKYVMNAMNVKELSTIVDRMRDLYREDTVLCERLQRQTMELIQESDILPSDVRKHVLAGYV